MQIKKNYIAFIILKENIKSIINFLNNINF